MTNRLYAMEMRLMKSWKLMLNTIQRFKAHRNALHKVVLDNASALSVIACNLFHQDN